MHGFMSIKLSPCFIALNVTNFNFAEDIPLCV